MATGSVLGRVVLAVGLGTCLATASCGGGKGGGGNGGSNGNGGSGGGMNGSDGAAGSDARAPADGAGDGSPGASENARRLGVCGLAGEYVVSQAAPAATCDGTPAAGDSIVVELGPDGAPRVRIGAYSIPVDVSTDCALDADSCVMTAEMPSTATPSTYTRVKLHLTKPLVALTGTFDAQAIQGHEAPTCTGSTTVTASPKRACEPLGHFTASAAATITSGQCGYGWPAGDVTITPGATSDRYQIAWGDVTFDPATLDATACTLAATKGVGSSLYVFNGAPRAVHLMLTITAAGVDGTIQDALTGTSDLGETCMATFHVAAQRQAPGGTALPAGCAIDTPFICGDGTCDTQHGEGCGFCLQDCPCASDLRCNGQPGVCARPCNVWADACPDGQRCDFTEPGYSSFSQGFCGPAGTVTSGSQCQADSDCLRGLHCQKEAMFEGGVGLCLPLCSREGVAGSTPCPSSSTCVDDTRSDTGYLGGCETTCDPKVATSCPGTDAVCWMPYTNVPGHCVPAPPGGLRGVGGTCPVPGGFSPPPACQSGLTCVGFNCTSTTPITCAASVCTVPCTKNTDCPAALPTCRINYCGPAM
jgi:hypothetical protein